MRLIWMREVCSEQYLKTKAIKLVFESIKTLLDVSQRVWRIQLVGQLSQRLLTLGKGKDNCPYPIAGIINRYSGRRISNRRPNGEAAIMERVCFAVREVSNA